MTDTTTPTDEVVDQSSSDIRDESLLDTSNEQDSAVEQRNGTDSGEQSQESGSGQSSTAAEQSSGEDKGFDKFAKSQGFDPDNLTDGEKKALKIAHDNQKAFRKTAEDKANERKVDKEVDQLYQPDENDDTNDVILKRMARLEAKDTTSRFWEKNPEDRKYEGKMAELLIEERDTYGVEAAQLLAANLPRLLREAKAASGAYDSDAARDAGRRDERERLRKSQEGAADAAHATQSASASGGKIDMEWVNKTYDPNNAEHRKMLDEAMARGDLY